MNGLISWMPLDTAQDLGWALIHFLWQGLLLAALLQLILPLCRNAAVRHNWALAILTLMAAAPVATFLFIHDFAKSSGASLAYSPAGALASAPSMDFLVLLWLTGIAVLSLRALGGWYLAQSLKRHDTIALPPALLERCHALKDRLTVTWPVRFLLSRRTDVPLVVGWLRPVVLIPVSAMSGLSPHQLDALILHELAHIRRLDTFANILLVAVETLLFYHPAVWWVGARIRAEREHCCDDFAVSACGDVAVYVEALASLEIWKSDHRLAMAANGGRLKSRVARLLDARVPSPRFSLSAVTGLAFLGLVTASVAMAQAPKAGAYPSRDQSPVMLRPIMETHTLPPYPKESLHLKEQGRVLLEVAIGKDGTVSRSRVVGPSGHQRLDIAANDFVKSHWRWQPAVRGGKPVAATTRVSVLFKLKPPA